jgi:hypothetical protein
MSVTVRVERSLNTGSLSPVASRCAEFEVGFENVTAACFQKPTFDRGIATGLPSRYLLVVFF